MPFIVTTKRPATKPVRKGRIPGRIGSGRMQAGRSEVVLSRHAVATLEEARREVYDVISGVPHQPGDASRLSEAIPGSGGSVGPLPDGTTIEVEAVAFTHDVPTGWVKWDGYTTADGQWRVRPVPVPEHRRAQGRNRGAVPAVDCWVLEEQGLGVVAAYRTKAECIAAFPDAFNAREAER